MNITQGNINVKIIWILIIGVPVFCTSIPNSLTTFCKSMPKPQVYDCKADDMFVCITKFNVTYNLLGYCRKNTSSSSGWDCCSDPKHVRDPEHVRDPKHVRVNSKVVENHEFTEKESLDRRFSSQSQNHPNVIFLLTDDQDAELGSLQAMPHVREILQNGGTVMRNYFVTTPICCPSRVSILSGRYPHNTGAVASEGGWCGVGTYYKGSGQNVSLPTYVQAAGYATGIFGKELNCNDDKYISPGWERFFVLGGNDEGHFYHNWFNDQGKRRQLQADEYMTDVIGAEAKKWIRQVHAQKRPFFAYIAPHAPHERATPAPGTMSQFLDVDVPQSPAYNLSCHDKHWMVRTQASLEPRTVRSMNEHYRNRLRSLVGVDDMLGDLVQALEDMGILNNTFIIFTSDHGWHMGQFRLPGFKAQPYDTDLRVPFMVRGPGIQPNKIINEIGLHIDIAPTIAAMIGTVPPPKANVDGRSLLPILMAKKSKRT